MKENNIINESFDDENPKYGNSFSFNKLHELQNLIKIESNLKQICKYNNINF